MAVAANLRNGMFETTANAGLVRQGDKYVNLATLPVANSGSIQVEGSRFRRATEFGARNSQVFWPLVKLNERSDRPFLLQFETESSGPEGGILKFIVHGYDEAGELVPFSDADPVQARPFITGPERRRITLNFNIPPRVCYLQVVLYCPAAFVDEVTVEDLRFVHDAKVGRLVGRNIAWEDFDFSRRWSQKGNRLFLNCYYGEFWADMPVGWRMEAVHPAAWTIVEELLFGKMEFELFGRPRLNANKLEGATRPQGKRPLLSFSAGTDSTAALALMPWHTAKFHTRRAYEYYFAPIGKLIPCPNFEAVDRSIATMKNVCVVNYTFEQIPLGIGMRHGGRDQLGYAATGILLADHFDAGALAFGSVLEQVFLQSGHHYSDIVAYGSSSQNRYRKMLRHAGLDFMLPVGGCSEVVTSAIVDRSEFKSLAVSCPRVDAAGTECGVCFKCFRKQRFSGTNGPDPLPEVYDVLKKYPLKSATSLIYACQKSGWVCDEIERYMDIDLDYLNRYHGYAINHLVPAGWQEGIRRKLKSYGIEPMTAEDELKLRSVGLVFWPEQHRSKMAGFGDHDVLTVEDLMQHRKANAGPAWSVTTSAKAAKKRVRRVDPR